MFENKTLRIPGPTKQEIQQQDVDVIFNHDLETSCN
jgi:hypothetical protein